jgi:hypothetical protein
VDTIRYYSNWQQARSDTFWGEIAPCDHVVQIYESDAVFIDSLAGFVGGGINAGDSCIVIATPSHIQLLEKRLTDFGVHPESLKGERYFPLDAIETLDKFMFHDRPNEQLFNETITEVLASAGFPKRRVRAFGEMVALLWALGLKEATLELESIWNKFCQEKSLGLFCAYPQKGFTQNIDESVSRVCCAHSKLIDGSKKQLAEVTYRDIKMN